MTGDGRLVDPADLVATLGERRDVVLLEVGRHGDDTGYRRGHLEGARFVFWKDLAWMPSRRQFPSARTMAGRLGSLGIGPDTRVVVYGDTVQFGVYVAWVIEMLGHSDVAVLDGGKEYWQAAGLPLVSRDPVVRPMEHPPGAVDMRARVGRDEVMRAVFDPGVSLLDVRSKEEYIGSRVAPPHAEHDHGAESRGHIPGAVHLFFRRFLDREGRFKRGGALQQELNAAGAGTDRRVIAYCRMGHRASLARFALSHCAGLPDVSVYDGSWTEWGSMVDVPVATGESPGAPGARDLEASPNRNIAQ